MEQQIQSGDQATPLATPPRRRSVAMAIIAAIGGIAVIVGVFLLIPKSPERVVEGFISDAKGRHQVSTEQVFTNEQAEQRLATVYHVPPKSAKVIRTITEESTATVVVEWVAIDATRNYEEFTTEVSFLLVKDGRTWKIDSVQGEEVVDFNFLFGR